MKVASLIKNKRAGRHADGGGLYLVVEPVGSARWSFLFRWRANRSRPGRGQPREMGMGSVHSVSLKRAREKTAVARALVADGLDPIAARKAEADIPSFGEMADEVMAAKEAETKSPATRARNKRALEVYAVGLRPIRIDRVNTADVLDVLKPIWTAKPETALKVRGLVEAVLNAAKAKGHRSGENPALWRGHLDHLLPKLPRLVNGHHGALPREKLPSFIAALRTREATSALALEFLILTAARSGEVLGATWDEVDLKAKVWTIPASRMKAAREHRVPLSPRAVEILEHVAVGSADQYVFPGHAKGKPLRGASFDRLMERMDAKTGITTHGFRSTFRDWVGEVTGFPRELAEAALAHTVGDVTERAYSRGDALEKRRKLMDAWARFCSQPTSAK
jgi:integrase